ncbi:MAG: L-threonine 3-dehydrogenase [Candidatus Aminicenantes bacterium RBG_19FT_COMBO_58_17]|nr:MAG: L-threonine 3-dehydrogenase [Candidatus Aminicenantes bacterium RBG_19FT_COMBO_58_17]
MKALMKTGSEPGAELREVAVPEPGPDEVLIRVKATAICGTDIHIYSWDQYAQERIKPPMIFGHEGCGEVVRIGSRVRGYAIGDLIAVETHIPCGECFQCRTGSQHICERMAIIGVHTDGVFAEYAKIPTSCCWKLPQGTNPDLGAILEPMGVAINGLLKEDINNKTVAIFGLGPIGQFGLAAAAFWGASSIFAVEPNAYRLDMARRLVPKATLLNPSERDEVKAILEATAGRGVDVSLEISGDPHGVKRAFQVVRKGGRVSLIGLPSKPIELDLTADIIYKEVRAYGSTGRLMWKTWYDTQKLLDSGAFDPTPIITHRFPLEKFDQALNLARSRQAGKILLYP